MILISLIHPSRGRANKAYDTYLYWMNNALSGFCEVEYILSIDKDDPQTDDYLNIFGGEKQQELYGQIIQSNNESVVDATNIAAKNCRGDILIYLSDDFLCPKDWNKLIVERMNTKERQLLRVNDGYQPMENEVLTIPIMTRALYEHLGYFFYPEYKSQWTDVDLAFTCKPYTILAPELVFKHEHPVAGYGYYDETYNRSSKNWEQGLAVYKRRSKEFGWSNAYNKMP